MTYTYLTTDELVMIESYHHQDMPVAMITERLKRSCQAINVINFLKQGHSAIEYYKQPYNENKKRCDRNKITLPKEEQTYIKEKVSQGWTPDVIIRRFEQPNSCSMRTLCRRFKDETLISQH